MGVLPVHTWSKSIKLGPPLTITEDAINEAFDIIEQIMGKQNEFRFFKISWDGFLQM